MMMPESMRPLRSLANTPSSLISSHHHRRVSACCGLGITDRLRSFICQHRCCFQSRELAQKHGPPAKRTRGSIRRRVRPAHFRDALAAEAVVALRPRAFLVRPEADRALDVRLLPLGARRPEW